MHIYVYDGSDIVHSPAQPRQFVLSLSLKESIRNYLSQPWLPWSLSQESACSLLHVHNRMQLHSAHAHALCACAYHLHLFDKLDNENNSSH